MDVQTTTQDPAPIAARRRWLGLVAVMTAMVLNLLDATIVTVAAPSIRDDLGGSASTLQWVTAIYTLALAAGLLSGGRLGDMFGRRRMLLIGLAGFIGASLICAAAWSPESLIAARAVQGLSGAMLVPQVFGLIRDLFPPSEIGKAFGALGPVIGLSTVAGPIVAGLLIDADVLGLGWRSVFLLNLPLGLAALALGAVTLPKRVAPSGGRLDHLGALISGAAMVLLTFPLVEGREHGWGAGHLLAIAASVALFVVFVLDQRRRAARGAARLVEFSVFTRRSYSAGVAFVVLFFGAIVGFSLTISLALQLGWGFDATGASLVMGAWAVGSFLGSGFGAVAVKRLGRRIIHVGLSAMIAALAVMVIVFCGVLGPTVGAPLLLALGVYGVGMGMVFVPLFDIIMGEIADHEVGSAAGMLESIQQLAASLGVAALGTVFLATAGAAPTAATSLEGVRIVTVIALALTAAAFCLGFLLPRRARQGQEPTELASEPPADAGGSRTPDLLTAAH